MNPGASSFSLVGHIIKNKKEKPDRKKKQRSHDHHFFFHLIVLLQENDEKKKDDRDLSLDSHHWLLSSSCWPINKEKKRPTEWRWRQWWLLFDRLKALLSQEKIKEKVGQAVSVSRAYCGPCERDDWPTILSSSSTYQWPVQRLRERQQVLTFKLT